MVKKITLIHIFIILGNIGVPCSAVILAFLYPQRHGWLFAMFIVGHSIERVWETFFTSHEKKRHEFHGDWTLAWVTFTYILICFFVNVEFYLTGGLKSPFITALGLFLYLLAFRLRWWGMASLGSQWSIHAVGAIKVKHYRLVKVGAYKYVRHPIYTSIMLEEIAIPLIANAYFVLLFAATIGIPLVFIRAFFEEKSSLRKFGTKYINYKKEVNMLIPLNVLWRRKAQ